MGAIESRRCRCPLRAEAQAEGNSGSSGRPHHESRSRIDRRSARLIDQAKSRPGTSAEDRSSFSNRVARYPAPRRVSKVDILPNRYTVHARSDKRAYSTGVDTSLEPAGGKRDAGIPRGD